MSVDAEPIRQAIADELSEAKYRQGEAWWSRLVDGLEEAWLRFVDWAAEVSDAIGGPLVLGLIVFAVLGAVTVAVTANLGRRRARLVADRLRREHEAVRGLDPAELERRADTAERSGDYATAFRLRFRAALVRLDRAGLIDMRPGTTSHEVSRALARPEFEVLADRFDEVVYGDRDATKTDLDRVRSLTAELLTGLRT